MDGTDSGDDTAGYEDAVHDRASIRDLFGTAKLAAAASDRRQISSRFVVDLQRIRRLDSHELHTRIRFSYGCLFVF